MVKFASKKAYSAVSLLGSGLGLGLGLGLLALTACTSLQTAPPTVKADAATVSETKPTPTGPAQLVMGYTTQQVLPYDGGFLYTGFVGKTLDGKTLKPPMIRDASVTLEPGPHELAGECYWRLQGVLGSDNNVKEPGVLNFEASAGHTYYVVSQIDEYGARCALSLFEKEPE